MTTVLRVKRRCNDEPCDALVLACKKRKTEGSDETGSTEANSMTAVVKFAGTVQKQEDIVEHLTKNLTKDELKASYKQHVCDVTKKSRLQTKEQSKENRYKVVNCFRSGNSLNTEAVENNWMTVLDVEDANSCCIEESNADNAAEYVYDLYFSQTEEQIVLDNDYSVLPIDYLCDLDDYRNKTMESDEGDSEDSNSESNWRNDYPDSDHSQNSEDSIDEEHMRAAVSRLKVDGEDSDLSSDNSDFVYTVDEADVDNYGYDYAKYKQRMTKELNGMNDDDDDDRSSGYNGVNISEVFSDDEDND